MQIDLYLFAAIVLIAAGTFTTTVCVLDHWLCKTAKRPPRHYRTAQAKEKLVEPVAVRKCVIYPEEVVQDGCV